MTNLDLASKLANAHGVTKVDAREMLANLFAEITDAASRGEEVSLPGFGKFKVKNTPEREGRNPATGETITIKAARKLTFSPAKAVKDRLSA
ncbi:HU family DNA-binding protein [Sphingomonas sp. AAP5]|nr:HU family DNA-binding protein [Sphingomonas sp. AAP5]